MINSNQSINVDIVQAASSLKFSCDGSIGDQVILFDPVTISVPASTTINLDYTAVFGSTTFLFIALTELNGYKLGLDGLPLAENGYWSARIKGTPPIISITNPNTSATQVELIAVGSSDSGWIAPASLGLILETHSNSFTAKGGYLYTVTGLTNNINITLDSPSAYPGENSLIYIENTNGFNYTFNGNTSSTDGISFSIYSNGGGWIVL